LDTIVSRNPHSQVSVGEFLIGGYSCCIGYAENEVARVPVSSNRDIEERKRSSHHTGGEGTGRTFERGPTSSRTRKGAINYSDARRRRQLAYFLRRKRGNTRCKKEVGKKMG